jgi:hypothetical protein
LQIARADGRTQYQAPQSIGYGRTQSQPSPVNPWTRQPVQTPPPPPSNPWGIRTMK